MPGVARRHQMAHERDAIRKIMMKIIRYALWKGTIDWSWSDNPAFV